jgi:methionyl-tRNA formyltransferase
MRIVFMGTPDFSVKALDALYTAGHEIVAVYTQPPKPAGRGLRLTPSAVHKRAEALGIPVETPKSLRKEEVQATLAHYTPEVIVVVAYGLLLPQAVLDLPPLGCFNIHASLLPRWRGAAPLQRAIMAGDTETGVTIMHMDAGLDTGAMALIEKTLLTDLTTTQMLHDVLADRGAHLMVQALDMKAKGELPFIPQPLEGVTYAEKIQKSEALIDWNKPCEKVARHIHGLSPFLGAYFMLNGERVKVLSVKPCPTLLGEAGVTLDDALTVGCATGAVQILTLQREGKKPMTAQDALKGWSVPASLSLNP